QQRTTPDAALGDLGGSVLDALAGGLCDLERELRVRLDQRRVVVEVVAVGQRPRHRSETVRDAECVADLPVVRLVENDLARRGDDGVTTRGGPEGVLVQRASVVARAVPHVAGALR